jgi:hypothetical protein
MYSSTVYYHNHYIFQRLLQPMLLLHALTPPTTGGRNVETLDESAPVNLIHPVDPVCPRYELPSGLESTALPAGISLNLGFESRYLNGDHITFADHDLVAVLPDHADETVGTTRGRFECSAAAPTPPLARRG